MKKLPILELRTEKTIIHGVSYHVFFFLVPCSAIYIGTCWNLTYLIVIRDPIIIHLQNILENYQSILCLGHNIKSIQISGLNSFAITNELMLSKVMVQVNSLRKIQIAMYLKTSIFKVNSVKEKNDINHTSLCSSII